MTGRQPMEHAAARTVPEALPPIGGDSTAAAAAGLRYDRASSRRDQLLSRVRRRGFCSITDLAGELGVSDMTIRRDVRRLQLDGELRIVHGGVSLTHPTLRTTEFTARANVNADAKRRIARAAIAAVRPDDVLAFDAGTTAFDVATLLPATFAGYVVTHSVPVIQQLLNLPQVRVTGLGGELYPASQAFVGPSTVEQIHRLHVRVFFLGVAAVDERGVYVEADLERDTKNALIDAASQVVVLAEHPKFTRSAPVRLCGFDRVHRLITDAPPPRTVADALTSDRVEVIIAR